MSNKMESFSYKDRCSKSECMHIKVYKEKLAWAIDKWLQVYNGIENGYTTMKVKNKDILDLNKYCMYCYMALGNVC